MPKLLILSKQTDAYRQAIESANLPGLTIVTVPTPDCELVFGEPTLVREILPALSHLKWVQATWAGVEPLLDPTLRRDYILSNARGVFGGLMSEFVFGYLLLHERKILQRLEAQKLSKWDPTLTGTLCGKTIGLLGVGSIGAHLADTAKHLGMTVRGYTRGSETSKQVDKYYHEADLLEFATGLDYLVSVLPNTSETRKIVNAELLSLLPRTAIFINVGRGSAVDESALIQTLETEKLAGAVLDVFEQEPLPVEHPFWHTKNLFITSHTSAPSFPKDIEVKIQKVILLFTIPLGIFYFTNNFPSGVYFEFGSIWYTLYVSFFNDLVQPFGFYFALCLIEKWIPWLKSWLAKVLVVFLVPTIMEVGQYLYYKLPSPSTYVGSFDPLDLVMYSCPEKFFPKVV